MGDVLSDWWSAGGAVLPHRPLPPARDRHPASERGSSSSGHKYRVTGCLQKETTKTRNVPAEVGSLMRDAPRGDKHGRVIRKEVRNQTNLDINLI